MKTASVMLITGMVLLGAMPAKADTIDPDLADRFLSAASQCTGKWYVSTDNGFVTRTAEEHLPRRSWLNTDRDTLEYDRARSIYNFANAMVAPAFETKPEGTVDASSMIKCQPNAELGLAMMQWLAGSERKDLRGPGNVYSWIAAAQQYGVGTALDPESARRNWLRWHISFGLPGPEVWSDGIDEDPYGNIERAGLLDFLFADAADKNGDAARRILARHHLDSDPERARALLSDVHLQTGAVRLEWEAAGKLTARTSPEELDYWLAMARRYPMSDRWRAKAQNIVAQINGGTIPVHPKRLGLNQVFVSAPPNSALSGYLDQTPIGLRALVDRNGKLVMIDKCDWTGEKKYSTAWNRSPAFREAWQLFANNELAPLPRPTGTASYGWVALPVVSYSPGKTAILRVEEEDQPDCSNEPVRQMPSVE